MGIKIGQDVLFYRDKQFPGKRGPYPAKIFAIISYGKVIQEEAEDSDDNGVTVPLVDIQIIGDGGGMFSEHNIPFLSSNSEDPGTRYCTPKEEN